MRKLYLLSTLVLALLFSSRSNAQDFSNKGKEFWLAYCYHVGMIQTGGGTPVMTVYLTSDITTTYTVEIYGVTVLASGTIFPNQVIPVTIPNAYWCSVNGLLQNRTVHVTAAKPIVVYSFITRNTASAATLCLPTNVLGKDYMATNFTQVSNEANSNSYITIIAVEDNTNVEITPTANTSNGWPPGVTQTITLNKGEIYQVLGAVLGGGGPVFTGEDLSGTTVKSVASASGGCKKIAVFSGSGKMNIGCSNGSSDNLYQQLYAISTWGKKYLTAPSVSRPNNYYRVYRSTPGANVYVNGVLIPAGSFTNEYYTFFNNTPNLIEADRPIAVSQYFTSQGCAGNAGIYDPDMIVLSPVEQNIKNVTLVNSPLTVAGTHQHNLHVIMKNSGTAQSSFRFDGAIPGAPWIVHPQDANYSYLYLPNVAAGNHTLVSDSGFNALAYGYGANETYGYSAGANVRDLYQQIGVTSQYGIEATPSVCVGTAFKFKVSLPYCADSIKWDLSTLPGPPPQPPTQIYSPACTGYDSTTTVNGIPIYWYSLPGTYTVNTAGSYPITITTYSGALTTCGSEQDIDFDLTVYDPPVIDFTYTGGECVAVPVVFTDATTTPRPSYIWNWDFGDPGSGAANTSNLQNPSHTFSAPGTYTVSFYTITTPGCVGTPKQKTITIQPLPSATLTASATNVCVGAVADVTFNGTGGTAPYTYYYTMTPGGPASINGGASVSIPVNTATPGPITFTLDSIRNVGSTLCVKTITGQSVTITVVGNATANLTSAPGTDNQTVCINSAITNITYAIGGSGTGASITAGGLPAGVTGNYSGGVFTISGTPTGPAGVYNFTVGTSGPCGNVTQNASITVTGNATLNLTSAPGSNTQTVCMGNSLSNITYSIGGSGTGATITAGSLPAGVSGVFSAGVFTISGTPSASGVFNYTVGTTGPCGNTTLTGTITVTSDATLNLTSAPGSNNQTLCINNAIANITYSIGGSGTGASITAGSLPAGVTGTFSGGVFTITGTPTAAGTFNYTVGTAGPCGNPTLTGTITVNPNATLNLTSAPGSNAQTVCINNAIGNITYAVAGGGTGASITAGSLPAGVTGSYSGGVFTITGTPTASGTFNYTVGTTGPCVNTTLTGSITVTANSTLTLSSAPGTNNQSICVNNAITNITYAIGGSGTGASITAGSLPPGVTGTYSGGVFTISGTPTAGGTFNFTVGSAGPCNNPTLTGTITVTPNPSLSLTSAPGSNIQTVCLSNAITTITYSVAGGATGASITAGSLPAGVTGTYSGGVFTIAGTPSASGTFNFTVGTTGPCVNTSLTGTITVTGNATLNLTSAPGSNTQTLCINNSITNITYSVGGSGTGASITAGALPAGVTGTFSGGVFTISGTPSASGTFNFTVGTAGPCVNPTLTGSITVTANSTLNLTSAPGSNVQSVCINNAIGNITYAVAGGGTGASITAGSLPAGVTGTYSGGVFTITGTPTAAGTFNFTVSTTGPCVNASLTGTITVTATSTLSLSSAPGSNTQTVCINNAITNITYNVGGSATGASITAGGLPAGVTGTYSGGVFTISGTPTTSGTFNFTVGTAGPCSNQTLTGSITVTANSTLNLTSAPGSNVQTVCINNAIGNITYAIAGGGTGASITAGSLPAGVTGTYSGGTFTITGTPTAAGTFNFTVGTTGPCVNTSLNGTITVTADATMSLSSAPGTNVQTLCVNNAITNITYNIGGSGTGASITAGSLPAGVTGTYSGGVFTISGTPTANGTFNFTVGTAGPCNNPTLTGSITVNADHAITRTSAAATTNQNVCVNTAITNITYTLSGGATGANVSATLPAGVTSSIAGNTITISGTPTATGTFNYNITTTGNGCVQATASGTINVTPAHALTLSSGAGTDNQTVCINNAITNITYTLSGGANNATVTGLPAGVTSSVAGTTVTISGTPTAASASPITYTIVTSGNSCATATITGNIKVDFDHSITLSSAASTTSQTVCTDRAMTPITYTLGGGATGATVTGLPPGVTSSVAGGTLTIQGSPTSVAGSPYNYSITTTGNSCIQATANGTMTVLQTPTVTFNPVAGICQDVPSFTVTGSPSSGVFSGPGINAGGLFNPSTAGAGDHTIRYTYTAANGCSNFQEQIISVYPLPVVDAGPDRGMIEGGQITLMPVITANFPVTYSWTPTQYLNNPNIANTIVSNIPDDRTFTLVVTSDHGCSASDKVFVKLLRRVEIPNIFSPNGDGVHDTWVIQYLESYPGCTVDIFNRYGQKIYHSEGYSKPWDGTVNGKPVPVGTYYYIVNPKNGRSQMSGYVDVIR